MSKRTQFWSSERIRTLYSHVVRWDEQVDELTRKQ